MNNKTNNNAKKNIVYHRWFDCPNKWLFLSVSVLSNKQAKWICSNWKCRIGFVVVNLVLVYANVYILLLGVHCGAAAHSTITTTTARWYIHINHNNNNNAPTQQKRGGRVESYEDATQQTTSTRRFWISRNWCCNCNDDDRVEMEWTGRTTYGNHVSTEPHVDTVMSCRPLQNGSMTNNHQQRHFSDHRMAITKRRLPLNLPLYGMSFVLKKKRNKNVIFIA